MRKTIYLYIFLLQALIITLSSCIDQKKYIYFQKGPTGSDTVNVAKAYVPRIQPGDILNIYVNSLNPAASSFFNPLSGSTTTGALSSPDNSAASSAAIPVSPGTSPAAVTGFLVDESGHIDFPLIGAITVAGLTTSEAKDMIKEKLKTYLKEPTVNVRFLNYKISVMGEVMHPSTYVIPNEKVTLPEAISLAGDLTPYAKHENILIVREKDGKKEFARVNLNSREFFSSPYYYLHSGDVVYVEQTKTKVQQNDPTLRLLPVILTTIAALALVFYRVK